jgi:nucleotidyltransferase substrate binding protein (TIGR01987 family)
MDKMDLLKKDLINAVGQLDSALTRNSDDPVVQAGCIWYFEFCFELATKTIKQAVVDEGLPECYSPKSCLKKAFEMKWIKNETVWLDMLEERNRVTHTYSQADALKIYGKLGPYLQEFQSLLKIWTAH